MDICGGVYGELCQFPHWDEVYGSGGRAAAALAGWSDAMRLHCYADDVRQRHLTALSGQFNFEVSQVVGGPPISFRYRHGLSTPEISPAISSIARRPSLRVHALAVLRFGMLEGDAVVSGERVVYDPQSPDAPERFTANGSTAQELAYVLNESEGRRLTGEKELDKIAARLAREEDATLVVLKCGPRGALVFERSSQFRRVPAYKTDRVFPIGSGDVFSAVFAHSWAVQLLTPMESASLASQAAAYYVSTQSLPVPRPLPADTELTPIDVACWEDPSFPPSVYIAAPFFSMAQRWLLDEARQALVQLGLNVFSPLHEVGVGPAREVAEKDLEAIRASRAVFALIDGLDPGTLFEVGYARAHHIPVIAFTETHEGEAMKMIEGSGCVVEDDFTTAAYKVSWVAHGQ